MTGKTRVDGQERRRVLKTLVAAGGVTALAGVAGRATAAAPVEAKPEPAQAGYRETDHIRTYYSKARI
jgi:hypothetical protein